VIHDERAGLAGIKPGRVGRTAAGLAGEAIASVVEHGVRRRGRLAAA
jgi:hypothetical protein